MKRSMVKLITAAAVVALALVLVVAASYAWFTNSTSPTASGLRVNIGADNTILVAPNITETYEGQTVNYPGYFSEQLNVLNAPQYAYLQNLTKLSLVSTADGVHWYFPAYYGETSSSDASAYLLDDRLQYANLQQLPADGAVDGGYAMLDFWVVSPMRCSLRVSVGKGNGGSYMIELPKVVADGNGGYALHMENGLLAACARVGFLCDDQTVTDASMQQYARSDAYEGQYRSLRGLYQQQGQQKEDYAGEFTVYEPNANLHSSQGVYFPTRDGLDYKLCQNGSYVQTRPIGYVGGSPKPVDISSRTVAQTATSWVSAANGQAQIEQIFQAYLRGVKNPNLDLLHSGFYKNYLGYQCAPYLQKGQFVKNSANLARAADVDGYVSPELFQTLATAGATDDVVIAHLEPDVPQRVRMFVWVEGQDVDCGSGVQGGSLLLNLELAGSTE